MDEAPSDSMDTDLRFSDDVILDIARQVPHDKLFDLGARLGFAWVGLNNILQKNSQDVKLSATEVLMSWKTKHGSGPAQRQELVRILESTGLGRLAAELTNVPSDASQPTAQLTNEEEKITPQVIDESRRIGLSPTKYMDLLKEGMAPSKRHRIMVVGPAGVGKTSLIKRLTGQPFSEVEKSTDGVEESTVKRSDVHKWEIAKDLKKDDFAEAIDNNMTKSEPAIQPQDRGSGKHAPSGLPKAASSSNSNDISPPFPSVDEVIERIEKGKYIFGDYLYSVWDFGGHTIYYITHPLFLSWRSFYILVFDMNLDLKGTPQRTETFDSDLNTGHRVEETNLELINFWLMSIYTHAAPRESDNDELDGYPKILIVGTFRNSVSADIISKRQKDLEEMIAGKPYEENVIKDFISFDNKECSSEEIESLQRTIDAYIKEAPYVKDTYPVKWLTFGDKLEGKTDESSQQKCCTMTRSEANDIMESLEIKSSFTDNVLQFYHDTGRVIYHKGCNLIVIEPQWLNDRVKEVITVIDEKKKRKHKEDWKKLQQDGLLTKSLIDHVWAGKEPPADILDVMERCDLVCKCHSSLKGGEAEYFIPCRSVMDLREEERNHGVSDSFTLVIDFGDFLPVGFLHRLYVRMARWVVDKHPQTPSFRYRQMMFCLADGLRIEVKNDPHSDGHENHVIVTLKMFTPQTSQEDNEAQNPAESARKKVVMPEDFLPWLAETLEDLRRTWARRLKFRIGITCTDCPFIATLCSSEDLAANVHPSHKCRGDCIDCDNCNAAICSKTVKRVFRLEESLKARARGPPGTSGSNGAGSHGPSGAKRSSLKRDIAAAGISTDASDLEFVELTRRLGNNIKRLGILLGFGTGEVQSFGDANRVDFTKNEGTYHMLMQWNKKEEATRDKLIEALQKAGEGKLAKILGEPGKILQKRRGDQTFGAHADESSGTPAATADT